MSEMNRQKQIDSIKKRILFYREEEKINTERLANYRTASAIEENQNSIKIYQKNLYQAQGALTVLLGILRIEFENKY